ALHAARGASRCATGIAAACHRNATTRAQADRTSDSSVSCGDRGKSARAQRHPAGGRTHRGPLRSFPLQNRARRAVAKLNLLLLAVLVACAIGLVSSQHKARKLFSELEREQNRARDLDIEYGRMQIEESTWGLRSRVETIANSSLWLRQAELMRIRNGSLGLAR